MNKEIEEFINKRPDVVAAYGYGSGVFKQAGYTSKDKPQIDLILVVDDLKEWHKKNFKLNKRDYSFFGKLYIRFAKESKLKKATGITYVSNIKENGSVFKYGTIEEKDLLKYLETWKSFYLPGRFQKTVYPIKETKELKEAIDKNRKQALLVSTYLQNKDEVTKKELLITLCGLSYAGDTRMKLGENQNKVPNIVEGSFNELDKMYKLDKKYFKETKDIITLDKNNIKKDLNTLPQSLYEYIKPYLEEDDEVIQKKILEYLHDLNKYESSKQMWKGLKTNGPCRSISYALQKVKKRFKK